MDEVIEISSSPEPDLQISGQATTNFPYRHQRNGKNKQPVEVIELTDSDDDEDTHKKQANGLSPLVVPKIPMKVQHQSQASPERGLVPQAAATHVSVAGPSSRTNALRESPRPSAKPGPHSPKGSFSTPKKIPPPIPLFLPDGDNNYQEDVLHLEPTLPDQEAILEPVAPPVPVPKQASLLPTDPDINPIDIYVARVLEIIPDVQPTHAHALIMEHIQNYQEGVVEVVLHALFDDTNYPKVDRKGKRKRDEDEQVAGDDEREHAKMKIDYGNKDRVKAGGPLYVDIALEQLLLDFPYIPKPHVRKTFFANNALYAPTYLFLAEEKEMRPLPYNVKTLPSRVTGKGKAKHDPEFDEEKEWLRLKLQSDDVQADEQMNQSEYEDCVDGIECGCCFSTYPFDKMIQCPDCHLFCSSCMTSYASNLLGAHDPAIVCMDQSGCKLPFPFSELRRFLTSKLLDLYERVKQRKEIEAAGLENLEECPFCEYKVVIENEEEKLFRCERAECGAVSCRECKKLDHLPKSCKEMEEDKHLDARHAIEEAMTRALMRNCPKCQKAFIKEHGCNKMTCPNCMTMSCYICRKVINGYDHFNSQPHNVRTNSKKCILWDPIEQRHTEEVTKAAKEALEAYTREHPNMDQEELKAIKVDLPPPPPAAPAPVAGPANPFGMGMPMGIMGAPGMAFAQQAQLRMQQLMAAAAPPPNPPLFNFNINFAEGLPAFPPLPALPRAAAVAAPPRKRRARRR